MEPLFWVGVLAGLALVTSAVTLYLTLAAGSTFQLRSEVRQLSVDVVDLFDKVEHWRGRDAVRRMRRGQEEAGAAAQIPPRGTPAYKLWLRSRVVPATRQGGES